MNDILLEETIKTLHEAVINAVNNREEKCTIHKDVLRVARDFLELYQFDKKN